MHVPPRKGSRNSVRLKRKISVSVFPFLDDDDDDDDDGDDDSPGRCHCTEFHTSTLYRESISLFCLNFILFPRRKKNIPPIFTIYPPPPRPTLSLKIVRNVRSSFIYIKRNFASFFIVRTTLSRFYYHKLRVLDREISTKRKSGD